MEFGRLITAMITPFNVDGSVNYSETLKIVDHLIENGTETILLAGTTGESPTLTFEEELSLFSKVVKHVNKQAKVMAGTGSNCTRTAVDATRRAEQTGVDGFLQVVPYYNKPSQEGMIAHFSAVSEITQKPILLYNIPSRTGSNMLPETMLELSKLKNIIGVKEAAGSVEQVTAISKLCPKDFIIYSGDDALTVDFMLEGASGVVSVASHIIGTEIQQMMQLLIDNKIDAAKQMSCQLSDIFEVLFISSNPAPVKMALSMMGFNTATLRLPLLPINDDQKTVLTTVLKKHNLI